MLDASSGLLLVSGSLSLKHARSVRALLAREIVVPEAIERLHVEQVAAVQRLCGAVGLAHNDVHGVVLVKRHVVKRHLVGGQVLGQAYLLQCRAPSEHPLAHAFDRRRHIHPAQ